VRRLARVLVDVALFAAAVVLALWGLLLVLYQGEGRGGGDTYVELLGQKLDAEAIGAVAIAVAVLTLGVLAFLLTRRDG